MSANRSELEPQPHAAGDPGSDGALPTPGRLLLLTLISMAVAEIAIMFVLSVLPQLEVVPEAFVDGSILGIVIFPLLYGFLYVPMSRHLEMRRRAEEELRKANLRLEALVEERTADLAENDKRVIGEIERRMSAEGEAWKSNDLLLRVVESSPCLMIIYDAATARCLYLNGRVSELLGYEPEDAIVQGEDFFRNLLEADDYCSFKRSVTEGSAVGGQSSFRGVVRLRHADGKRRRFRVETAVLRTSLDELPREMLFTAVAADR